MVATTLKAGQAALVHFNAEDGDDPTIDGQQQTNRDTVSFVLLAPITDTTVIYLTDRTWTPTANNTNLNAGSFAAPGSGDGTVTFTAGADLPAGTVITFTTAQLNAGGINFADTGDTLYIYQGTNANTPTSFLFAANIAEGVADTTFTGSLVNTGLSAAADTAIVVGADNGTFAGRTWNIQNTQLLDNINNQNFWATNENSPQEEHVHLSNIFTAPDQQTWVAASGGGNALIILNKDATVNGGNTAYAIASILQNTSNDAGGGNTTQRFFHPTDIVLDPLNNRFFVADSDASQDRILQGTISSVLTNPGVAPTMTVLYREPIPATSDGTGITGIAIDSTNSHVYFTRDNVLQRVNYNTPQQTPVTLATLPVDGESGDPKSYANEIALDLSRGFVYVISTASSTDFTGNGLEVATVMQRNAIFQIADIAPTDTNSTGNTVTKLIWPAGYFETANPALQNGLPDTLELNDSLGKLTGIDVNQANGELWFTSVQLNNGGNGYTGGIFKASVTGPNLAVTTIYTESSSNANFQFIDVNEVSGRYYVTSLENTGNNTHKIYTGALTGGGTLDDPVVFGDTTNYNGLAGLGLQVHNAPTLTGNGNANLAVTESTNAPGSPEGSRVTLYSNLAASDIDTASGDELTGAQVRISANFVRETTTLPGHQAAQDFLSINGTQNGTDAVRGITWTYDAVNGVLTLTGAATVAEYAAILQLVQFSTSGDNVTNFGNAPTRTISASVFDGLLYSDEIKATVAVTGINDRPLNSPGAPMGFTEDTTGTVGSVVNPASAPANGITGISVADVDADPAVDVIYTELSVNVGTLTVRTDVPGGVPFLGIDGNGTALVTLSGTQNQINATLAAVSAAVAAGSQGNANAIASAPNGVVYTPPANFNGRATLTIVTNDNGKNGNDPAQTGGPTDEEDSDTKFLNVANVNDAPTVGGDGTEDSPAILEDIPNTNLNAQSVATLFGGQFLDALDVQQSASNPTGSVANILAGIAIVANGSSASTGQWQYYNGSAWVNIGAATTAAAKLITATTLIRFEPVLNFNGAAPTLTAHLVETGGIGFSNGSTTNLTGATGGTTIYSTATVVLSQAVTPVNDKPVIAALSGDNQNYFEGDPARLIDASGNNAISDVDSPNFNGGSLTASFISGSKDAAEDQLLLVTGSTGVTIASGVVSVDGVAIGTVAGGGAGAGDLVVTFTSDNATPAAVQKLIAALGYVNSDTDNPTTGSRGINVTLDDGDGTANGGVSTTTVTAFVFVLGINDAPAGADKTLTIDEDSPYTFTAADFGFTDVDSAFGGVRITTLPAVSDGKLLLDGVAVLTNQVIAVADIPKLTYTPVSNDNGTSQGSFTFQVRDDGVGPGQDASPNTITFDVTAVNDAPVNTVGAAIDINEDAATIALTGISIADVEVSAAGAEIFVTFEVEHGTIVIRTDVPGGIASTLAESVNTITVRGTVAQINATLAATNGLTYKVDANYNGSDQLKVTTNDNGTAGRDPGASGDGTSEEDVDSRAITIASVNDAPSGTDKTVVASEDDPYTFTWADFGFTDPVDADDPLGVRIDELPVKGTLVLNGVNVTDDQVISKAAIDDGDLTFVPAANQFGTGYASFKFSVQDDGGTANGGVEFDQSPNTMTVDVTADNQAPAVDLDADGAGTGFSSAYTEGAAAAAISDTDVEITDADAADDIVSATITITNAVAGDVLNVVGTLPGSISVDTVNSTDTTLILTGTGTKAEYEAAIEQITFSSTSDDPTLKGTNVSRSISVTVNDGDADSAAATSTISVADVNDAPTGTSSTITAVEDSFRALTLADLGFVDADGTFASVTISAVTGGKIYFDDDGAAGPNAPQEVTLPATYSEQALTDGKVLFKANQDVNGTAKGTITCAVSDDDGATDASPNVLTVDVTAANDAPVANDDTLAAFEDTQITYQGSDLTANDTDVDNDALTVTAVSNATGGTAVRNNDGSVTFKPTADFNGVAGFDYTVSDGNGGTKVGHATVDVASVNDAPTVAIGSGLNAVEQVALDLKGKVSVGDVDSGTGIISATLTVTHGILTVTSGTSGATVGGSGTGTVTITGTAAQIDALLVGDATSTITYASSSNAPPASANLTVTVNDLGNSGGGASGPNLIVNGSFETQNGSNTSAAYVAAEPADYNGVNYRFASSLFGWSTASGLDFELNTANTNQDFETGDGGAALDMEINPGQGFSLFQDIPGLAANQQYVLSLSAAQGTGGSLGANPTSVLEVVWNGNVIATITSVSTEPVSHSFAVAGAATGTGAGGANRLELREVGSGSDARGTSLDAISLRAVESLSSSDTETIAIAAVNDAPSLTAPTNAKIGYSEQAAGGTALMQGVVLSDVDLPANFAGGSISLTVSGSEGGINLRSGSAFVINSNGADGTFSLARQEGPTQVGIGLISGIGTTNVQITDLIAPANLARLNDLLDEFVYLNNSDAPTPGDRTVTLTFNDGGNTGGGGLTDAETQTLTVTAVNDAPVNNVPAAQTGTEDVALVFSAANSNAITISDADIGAGVASVVLTVANGTLTLGDTTDLAQPPVGDGTGTVALFGTVDAINKALEGLSYLGALNSNGARTLTIATSDNGFTGPNLIVNPGAETGVRAADYSSSVVPSGWTRVDAGGSFTALNYDVPGQASSDLDENDSAAVGGGNGYFAGGPSTPGSTAIRQIIDVSGSAAAIDAGTMLANLSGLFGGYLGVNDRMTMTARFLDGMGVQLATASIGDVTAAERGSQTLLVPEFAIAGVPVGTRSIEIVLTAIDSGDGNYGNGYADNVSLVLSQLVSNTVSIDLTPVDDAAVAVNDTGTTNENTVATGNVFDNNGSGPDSDVDGPALSVAEVNGQAADVGQTITLGSGAKLTLNSNGSYSYDPNGKYVTLTDNSSGAVNTADEDSFNYTLTNGNTATVTITINGVAGPGDRLAGDATDNTITGTPQVDFFLLQQGGNDTAFGLAANDIFYFGGALTAADNVTGGSGFDTIVLQGDYSGGLTLDAGVTELENISMLAGTNTAYGDPGTNLYDYNLTIDDANFAAGVQARINGGALLAGEDFTFDGSDEKDAKFVVYGGRGKDDLTGGAGNDIFFFAGADRFAAGDTVDGGGGYDGLFLRGNYTIDFTQAGFAGALAGIENLTVSGATDERYGRGGGSEFDYAITWDNDLLAVGSTLTVNASTLGSEESLAFNGSDEKDGNFRLFGGAGNDVLTGGDGADQIFGGLRGDTLTGGAGNDIFRYNSVAESNSTERDGIQDFNAGDLIDVSKIDANVLVGGNQAFSFIGNAAFSNTAGELRFENISLGGPVWMIQADTDGNGFSDFEVVLVINPPDPITASDFIL